jgi:hypothetical protein
MLDDDIPARREPTLDELLESQNSKKASWHAPMLRIVSIVALAASIGLLATGRSLPLHLIGYVSSALIASMCASFSVRSASRTSSASPKSILLYVVTTNLIATVVAAVHAGYLFRRYI